MWLVGWQPLPTAITPSTTPSLSLSRQIPAGCLTWGLGSRGGVGGAESLDTVCLKSLREGKVAG